MNLFGADARAWLARAAALLRGARLSRDWPDPRVLAEHLMAMALPVERGLWDALAVVPATGLPPWTAWQQILSERDGAERVLAHLADGATLAAEAHRSPAHARLADRHAHLTTLCAARLAPAEALDVVRLRAPAEAGAPARAVFDKLDAAAGFVRLTVDLVQGEAAEPLVRPEGDGLVATPALRGLLYRSSALDAELVFLQLAAREGVTVERVVRATVGPVWLAGILWPSDLLGPPPADGGIAGFGLQTAAVDLPHGRVDDPLAPSVGADALAERQAARARLGYAVHHDRRLVATPSAVAAAKAWCQAAGTRNVVRVGR
ncbi:MAG: hypothetical protein H6702_16440 [Myxococcales bacterium]|nr:hypothetical protein [Myxococcales bacterium]